MNDALTLGLIGVAGVVGGFLNTVGGGGSFLTLPALMLLGLPADVANGTNRVGIVAQAITGSGGFFMKNQLDLAVAPWVVAPTVGGALLGSGAAIALPVAWLEGALLATLLGMALLLALKPSALVGAPGEAPRPVRGNPRALLGLVGVGFYGGFAQAGVGFLLLAVLGGLLRYDLVRANALKVMCNLMFGAVALGTFALAGDVAWAPGAVLALSMSIGSAAAVRFAVGAAPGALRWALVACVTVAIAATLLR